LSLVEVIVTISLTAVLGLMVVYAVQNNHRLHRTTVDEASGLADVKTVVERLGRDIRSARAVDPAATRSQLVLWIDANSDNVRDPSEVVTWEILPTTDAQYNVLRQTVGATAAVQSRTLVDSLAFCYWSELSTAAAEDCLGSFPVPLSITNAASTRLVTTTLTYDSNTSTGTAERSETFSARLRNVA
jgi:hypothetical protein